MKRRVHIRIRGRVQGVCFRMCACEEADRLGLTGWVRNCSDGSVEIVAEGEIEHLADLVKWCHAGPSYARVQSVENDESEATGEFQEFRVAH
ncbi:MAG: acylphosphatase [Verrucomicrobiota bacterium]|nr:acylphosphatase [Verrucomicrobiota bacterium]